MDASKFTVTQEMTDSFYSKAEVTSRGTILNLEAAIEAALAAALEQPAVHVKPLEWNFHVIGDGSVLRQNSWVSDRYQIIASLSGKYDLRGGAYKLCDTLEEAQAAAQSDYERRILRAIDPRPSDEITALKAENEWLRKVLALVPSQKHFDILCEAMEEVKATSDGKSDQPIADIVSWCLEEIATLNGGDNE